MAPQVMVMKLLMACLHLGPMRNAIIQSDWYFSNVSVILKLLMQKFADDDSKVYNPHCHTENLISTGNQEIKNCRNMRMIVYQPNGDVFTKKHICG